MDGPSGKGTGIVNAESIVALYTERKASLAGLHSKMREVAGIYNGTVKVPLPDMDRTEKTSIPNLLAQGIDQMAGRINSTTPVVTFASSKPGVRKHDRNALASSRVISGWWQEDRLRLKMGTRSRRLIAYSQAPVVVRWKHEEHRPTWHVRHPIETYPSMELEPGCVTPTNCIFAYDRTLAWCESMGYESKMRRLIGRAYDSTPKSQIISLIEFVDAGETVLVAAGYYGEASMFSPGGRGSLAGVELTRYSNLIDECPVVIPSRMTLDSATGQFDQMIGIYYTQARLMALEIIAVEKDVFPDTWLVGRTNETPKIIDGPHDGRTGLVSIAQGGDIKLVQSAPGYMTQQTIDRLERNGRVTAGIPSEFGGESGTNIRTGRRGDAVMSAVIDFPVAEAQDMLAFALQEENEIAIKLAKAIDRNKERTIFVGTGNARRPVTYTALGTFETDEHVVSYPMSGTDANGMVIGIGQRVGLGYMSTRTAAELDPLIDNPEAEHDQIIVESIEKALVGSIQQQAASGAIPPLTLARVMMLVRSDRMELAEALHKVTEDALKEEAKKREEEQAQMGMGGPAGPQTPEQVGAMPTVAAMAGGIPSPDQTMPGMKLLGDMLGRMRRPAMTIEPYRNLERGAV